METKNQKPKTKNISEANTFYITTPIYYPNDIPHIGHAYTTTICDILARWNKLQGKEVLFVTGTDEHGKKIQDTAKSKGIPTQKFVDQMAEQFKDAWKLLNIDYTRFIKTTDPDHEATVQEILQKVYDKGDIYLGEYEGHYCVGCEAYLTEKELIDGCCPIHKKKVEVMKEKTYFFKIQKYKDQIIKLLDSGLILPKNKTQEMKNRVKELDRGLSISRTSFDWGIPLPFDKEHVAYVWFDALLNYYTAAKGIDEQKFWPADLHVVAKDIAYFHAVIWPAILLSAELPISKNVFVHGYWTMEGEKMSKSLGNVINIPELVEIAGTDSARYFLAREIPFGDDGDFSKQALIDRHNNELANKLGNLISRTSSLAERYGIEKFPENEQSFEQTTFSKGTLTITEDLMSKYKVDKALEQIIKFLDSLNAYVQTEKPWENNSRPDRLKINKGVLYNIIQGIKTATILLSPFIPETSEKIAKHFDFEIFLKELDKPLKNLNIKKAPILFQKIEPNPKTNKQEIQNKTMENVAQLNNTSADPNPQQATDKREATNENITEISFQDFSKLDLRVAEIINVEDIPNADKLYKLSLYVGKELGTRTICAGIKQFYNHENLKGKKIIIIANLEPRKLRGIESQGMLLAASSKDKKTVSLITPDQEIAPGSTVG